MGLGGQSKARQLYLLEMETVLILQVAGWTSGRVRINSPPLSFVPRIAQIVGSSYTDWVIPAHPMELWEKEVKKGLGHLEGVRVDMMITLQCILKLEDKLRIY